MSLLVTGIRLPFDEPETAALDRARRLTGLLSSETEAAVCRVSIDARRGQISRVYSGASGRTLRREGICGKAADAVCAL